MEARRANHAEQGQKLLLKSSEGTTAFIREDVGDRKLRILHLLEAQQIWRQERSSSIPS